MRITPLHSTVVHTPRAASPHQRIAPPGPAVVVEISDEARRAAEQVQAEPGPEQAEPGPKTFRPHVSAEQVAAVLADKGLRWAIMTTPEGRVLGVVSREALARAGDPG